MPTLLNRMSTPRRIARPSPPRRACSLTSPTRLPRAKALRRRDAPPLGHCRLSRLAVHVGDGDHRPFLGELPGRRLPDAKRAPGDDDNLPVETRHAPLLTVIRRASIGVGCETVKLRRRKWESTTFRLLSSGGYSSKVLIYTRGRDKQAARTAETRAEKVGT